MMVKSVTKWPPSCSFKLHAQSYPIRVQVDFCIRLLYPKLDMKNEMSYNNWDPRKSSVYYKVTKWPPSCTINDAYSVCRICEILVGS